MVVRMVGTATLTIVAYLGAIVLAVIVTPIICIPMIALMGIMPLIGASVIPVISTRVAVAIMLLRASLLAVVMLLRL
ncbi:hypothetical protein [Falsirhodobacter sp. alg1]|uniref:hypothetical protein n=1 Tax=Falsirhodobacter sp. alg1 TaxID=1472418 RepID=UPI0005F0BB91|nr:hypothetical protein [Falsirhodobacter sp. alg1]